MVKALLREGKILIKLWLSLRPGCYGQGESEG